MFSFPQGLKESVENESLCSVLMQSFLQATACSRAIGYLNFELGSEPGFALGFEPGFEPGSKPRFKPGSERGNESGLARIPTGTEPGFQTGFELR